MTESLEELIISHYPVSKILTSESLKTKGGRRAYKIISNEGKFLVKVTSSAKKLSEAERDLATLEHLEKFDFPSPCVVRSKKGEAFVPYGPRYVSLQTFIEGRMATPSLWTLENLGELLGTLHSIPTENFPYYTDFTPENILPRSRENLLKEDNKANHRIRSDLLDEIESFPKFDNLPKTLIHTDPYYWNLVETSDKKLYLVDWDDAGIAPAILDIGYAIAHLCTLTPYDKQELKGYEEPSEQGVTFREDWAKAFLTSYQKTRPLTPQEKELLPSAMKFGMLVYITSDLKENYERFQYLKNFKPF